MHYRRGSLPRVVRGSCIGLRSVSGGPLIASAILGCGERTQLPAYHLIDLAEDVFGEIARVAV